MANQEIDILVKLKDDASAGLKNLQKHTASFKESINTVGIASAAAFAGISAFALSTIKDFSEAEAASAQLKHAVIDVTHASEAQLQATNDLADALERKGVLDGDNIKVGLAQLSTFGLSNDAVQKLGGSLADLAVNQFWVKASGDQLSQTANMIAKALNWQFWVLEKSGIRFTEAQQSAIKFGTELEKVKAINEGFAQNLKYTNEVALTTTEGKMAAAAVKAQNLSEAIGWILAPVLKQLQDTLLPILASVQEWIDKNPELTKNIVLVGLAVTALWASVLILGPILSGLGTIFTVVTAVASAFGTVLAFIAANPIVLLWAAIVALWAGIYYVVKNWETVWPKLSWFWESIKVSISEIVGAISTYIFGTFENIKNTVVDNINFLSKKAQEAKNFVSNILEQTGKAGANFTIQGALGLNADFSKKVDGARADGWPVRGGSAYLVGERWPEIFTPRTNGTIISNQNLSPNISINMGSVSVRNEQDAKTLAREIRDELTRSLQLYKLGIS